MLGELVELTPEAALAGHVIKITGPLIRIVGDRFPAPVKSAILQTLGYVTWHVHWLLLHCVCVVCVCVCVCVCVA